MTKEIADKRRADFGVGFTERGDVDWSSMSYGHCG
jgi:hypothetical protein